MAGDGRGSRGGGSSGHGTPGSKGRPARWRGHRFWRRPYARQYVSVRLASFGRRISRNGQFVSGRPP
ncbi:hypothetical protein PCLA_05r0086 [Pseudomonas citronellolis]|nr:hypothetical protein PCLA_05r0086 [Pseudomonas citronellolis]